MRRQFKKPKIVLGVLVTLALILSMFVVTVPVTASEISGSKTTSPASPNIYYVGDIIHWVVRVTNPSTNSATNTLTRVWDTLPDGTVLELISSPLIQAPGQSNSWDVYYTVKAADIVNINGYLGVKNKAEAVGFDTKGDSVSVLMTKKSRVIQPDISIEKTVDCDGDDNFAESETTVGPDTPTWKIVVSNTGFDPVYNITVTDTNGQNYTIPSLGVGASDTHEYAGAAINVTTTNTATAVGEDEIGGVVGPVSDNATNIIIHPELSIVKLVDCNDDGQYSEEETTSGPSDDADWYVKVTNTGDCPVYNITVTDSNGHNFGPDFDLLANGNYTEFYYTTTITETTTNSATAEGKDELGGTVSAGPVSATNRIIPCRGSIEILKKDGSGALLGGACFNVTPNPYDGGTLRVCDDDATYDKDATDGVILLEDVPCGNYTVTEDTPPLGYVAVTGSQDVEVTNGSEETVEFTNTPCIGSIEILKRDDAGAPLAGACFNVTPNPYDGGTLTVCDDDGNDADTSITGRILLTNVPPGDYDIVEVQAPPGGYVADPDVETVTVTCDTMASATFTNSKEECTGCLKICKYEDKNGNGQKDWGEPYLSGWTFNVTGPGYSQLVTTGGGGGTYGCECDCKCDYCVTIWDLVAGEYTVTEVTPLPDGWTNTDPKDGSYTKTIYVPCYEGDTSCGGDGGCYGCDGGGDCCRECPTVVEFGNQRECTGCLKICKYEDKDGDGQKDYGEPYLSGWVFNVTGPDGYSWSGTTGAGAGTYCSECGCDYCVTICDLVPGEYTVTEVTPLPEGWTCTTGNPRTVTVVCDRTTTVKFGNQGPCSGCLKIYKYEDKNGNGRKDWYERYLANWEFTVTDIAGNSWSGTTNRYGYVTICNLSPGEYTVTEVTALPEGWTNTDPGGGPPYTKTVTVSCGRTTTVKFGNRPPYDSGCSGHY